MATTNKFEETFNKNNANNKSAELKDESSGKEKEMTETITEAKDNVKSFVGGKAKQAMESVGVEDWQGVKDRAGQMVTKAKEIATDMSGRFSEGASHAVDQVSSTVKKYPFPAILVGFGVGALVGALLSNRRSA